jgi:hypothetical protein
MHGDQQQMAASTVKARRADGSGKDRLMPARSAHRAPARDRLGRQRPCLAIGCQNGIESRHRSPLNPVHDHFNDRRNITKVQLLVEERLHGDLIGGIQARTI